MTDIREEQISYIVIQSEPQAVEVRAVDTTVIVFEA